MHIAASLTASTITPRNPKTKPQTVNLMSSKYANLCDPVHVIAHHTREQTIASIIGIEYLKQINFSFMR